MFHLDSYSFVVHHKEDLEQFLEALGTDCNHLKFTLLLFNACQDFHEF